jgi:hypothetical protein
LTQNAIALKIPFRNEDGIKTFSNEEKPREILASRLACVFDFCASH